MTYILNIYICVSRFRFQNPKSPVAIELTAWILQYSYMQPRKLKE